MPDLRRDLEAVLFAAGRPLDLPTLVAALSHDGPVSAAAVHEALGTIEDSFPPDGTHGFELVRAGESWVFRTSRHSEQALSTFFDLPEDPRLSAAALETLAIVAYLQPVTRPEVADVRGVNSDSPVQSLLDRGLIAESGRNPDRGGAVLYRTTERFLLAFGLETLERLPSLEGFAAGADEQEEIRRRLAAVLASE